jgi:hypothetical protein
MLFCPRTKHAKQAAAAKRSTREAAAAKRSTKQALAASPKRSTRDSAVAEKKPREQAVENETALTQKASEDATFANGVKNETALAQKASADATAASICPNVNDVYATPVHELLSTLGDDLSTTDEEHGILAMFHEINQKFPDLDTAPAQAYMKATLAGMFQVYTETLKNINDQEITRDLTTRDEQYGMTAMFRELGEKFPDTTATTNNPHAQAYINAMCAQLLHVYSTAALKAKQVPQILHCDTKVVELDEDFGPQAMLKEVADRLGAAQAQAYMLDRFVDLSTEAEKRGEAELGGCVLKTSDNHRLESVEKRQMSAIFGVENNDIHV